MASEKNEGRRYSSSTARMPVRNRPFGEELSGVDVHKEGGPGRTTHYRKRKNSKIKSELRVWSKKSLPTEALHDTSGGGYPRTLQVKPGKRKCITYANFES